jgi:4'-phosphopantetheinyl transferase
MRHNPCFFGRYPGNCELANEGAGVKSMPNDAISLPWRAPPEGLTLGRDEVHVWQASLNPPRAVIGAFRQILAADELARASRFVFDRDRRHFIAARGMLRTLLGRYVNREPATLSFHYGAHGKPTLVGEGGEAAVHFNLSHSHGAGLYAFSRGREVGIDLERMRADLAIMEIALRFFSPAEAAMLSALPNEAQQQAFFRCWTRKEAYVKARGHGLSLPLDQLDMPLEPEDQNAGPGRLSEACRWTLREFVPAPGYAAALAVEGRSWRLACWRWPDPPGPSF